jgi:hypothetical protein
VGGRREGFRSIDFYGGGSKCYVERNPPPEGSSKNIYKISLEMDVLC